MKIDHDAQVKLDRARLDVVIEWLDSERDVWNAERDNEDERDTSKRAWLQASREAFAGMAARGRFPLSEKQAAWVADVAKACDITLPHPPVPRGREIPLMFTKGPPLPPGRKR